MTTEGGLLGSNTPPSESRPAGSRSIALGELAVFAALATTSLRDWLPISATPYLFLLAWSSLRLRGLRWRDVGFSCPQKRVRALALGSFAGVAMELFSTFCTVPLLSRWTGKPPDLTEFRPLVGNLALLLALLIPMWLLAGFGEELVHRGYLMHRLVDVFGPSRSGWIASLLVASTIFGAAHEAQELTGMLQEGFAGLLLGTLYLASGRNLTVPIVAHGVSNTVAFVLIYLGRYPGV